MLLDYEKNVIDLVNCLSKINDKQALKINPKGMVDNNGQYVEY